MENQQSTCWTLIRGAAGGRKADREVFAGRYVPVVRACLAAHWKGTCFIHDLDDAVQEVFLECFRKGGVLERSERAREGGFRAFLAGVVRNVALRIENRKIREARRRADKDIEVEEVRDRGGSLSRAFDRAWAKSLFRQAADRQRVHARASGEAAERRVELLRLRFEEDMPIREISRLWGIDAETLHREYRRARKEFKEALIEVLTFHQPGSRASLEQECGELLDLLG